MPISAVDAITPAFQHAKRQLIQPFRMGQWARLALVGFLAGELSSGGGCNVPSNFQMPQTQGGSQRLFAAGWPSVNPALLAGLIALAIVVGIVLWLVLIYLNSMMRFVLFDSVVAKECHIREYWGRRRRPGFRYFVWQLLFGLSFLAILTILIGIPAAIAFAAGWLKNPGQHVLPLVLGGIVLFFVFFALIVAVLVITVLTKDFIVPQMALEDISAMDGWRRLWPMLKSEVGGYAGYIGMKIVLAIGAGIILGIITFIAFLMIAIIAALFGVAAVLTGKIAGLSWNAYTITLAIVAGCVLFAVIFYVIALISVPAIVFFPAYSLHFLASRYPALDALMHPTPPAPPEIPPPMLPPEPSPVG